MLIIDLLKKCKPETIIDIINNNHPINESMARYKGEEFDEETLKKGLSVRKTKITELLSDLLDRKIVIDKDKVIFCVLVKDFSCDETDNCIEYFDWFSVPSESIKNFSPDNEDVDTCALSFVPWSELLGRKICDKSIEEYGIETLAAEFIWEITFYGWTEADMEKEKTKLTETIEEYEESEENGTAKYYTVEEVFAELGYVDTRTEEEKQKDLENMRLVGEENFKKCKEFIISEKDCL